jgi:hypothetical protein
MLCAAPILHCTARRCSVPLRGVRYPATHLDPSPLSSETSAVRPSIVAMTTASEEPRPTPHDASHCGQIRLGVQEKEQSKGENMSGWAIVMPPLRRKGGKSTETASASLDAAADVDETTPRINALAEDDRDSAQCKGQRLRLVYTENLRGATSEDRLLLENHEQEGTSGNGEGNGDASPDGSAPEVGSRANYDPRFKVYKRRWFGVVQLVLLNAIVSWDVSATILNNRSLLECRRLPK